MVEGGVQLPCFAEVLNVPNVKAMVVVDTRQPVVGGVIGHCHCVRVPSLSSAGEQLAGGAEMQREPSPAVGALVTQLV